MNIVRITGIMLFILGIYLMNILNEYDLSFFGGFLSGILTTFGLGLLVLGKFKFWT